MAYALGAGKAIISTPYWHAAEVLDHGRGLLVPFESPAAIAKATIKLLDDDKARQAMRERAYFMFGLWSGSGLHSPIWPPFCERVSVLRSRFKSGLPSRRIPGKLTSAL